MESISPGELALELLNHSLRGGGWPEDVLDSLVDSALDADPAVAQEASRALFGIVAERLSDLFEPALCDSYADLFSHVLARAAKQWTPEELAARYRRVRAPGRCDLAASEVGEIAVLSRVTLGADVAVTSVLLDALKRAFPEARIRFAAPRKAWELFAADPRVAHLPVEYTRTGTLQSRIDAWSALRPALASADLVVDPDSRLTQLGLLPVCEEERYLFFESRAYGGDGKDPLPVLARRWAARTFGVEDARPYVAIAARPEMPPEPAVTLSLGVGENPAKRIGDSFEEDLLAGLMREGAALIVDRGAGGEERERVDRALRRCAGGPGRVVTWDGAFAPFASMVARSRLYVGYDSAAQHVAAACGTPLVSVFAGWASERMYSRWRPAGPGPAQVICVERPDPPRLLVEALSAAYRLWS